MIWFNFNWGLPFFWNVIKTVVFLYWKVTLFKLKIHWKVIFEMWQEETRSKNITIKSRQSLDIFVSAEFSIILKCRNTKIVRWNQCRVVHKNKWTTLLFSFCLYVKNLYHINQRIRTGYQSFISPVMDSWKKRHIKPNFAKIAKFTLGFIKKSDSKCLLWNKSS